MKRISIVLLMFVISLTTPYMVFAQGMMRTQSAILPDDHTAREEAEGKEIWEELQAKQLECKDLTDENYESLGEYYMGQMTGNSHAAMNTMMERMMGKEGEEQMHLVMGKRLSGCQTDAQFPQNGVGFMPMMWMMGGGGNPAPALSGVEGMGYGGWSNMMGGWNGFGLLGWIPMLLFWIILILGVVALLRYLGRSGQQQDDKTPLKILKERYARGEINKKEFEEKKKDLAE